MTEPEPTRAESPASEPAAAAGGTADGAAVSWEAFYSGYRKPGYIPGFEITSKLGGGVFGLVFKATRQSIGKDYAIKFLRVDDAEVRRAVLAELDQVRYFAQIDHPNLVSIEDRGEVDGIPYLVMAYAGAETLQDRLASRPAGVPDAATRDELLRLFLQACRGVAALHERSLVHFDLKPANVFLKGGVARVGDYGLSKLITHSRGSLSMGRGTPYYMAPEMLRRRGDHRSDLYSLGVMLYEIAAGDLPFRGDSEWQVLRQHESAALDFPDHVPPALRRVVARCMAKDPADRFADVHALIAELGAPVGVGAAAWQDTRRGVDAGTERRGGDPDPAGGGGDPYRDFKAASREAMSHAGKIARDAMQRAKVVARQASQDGGRAVRAALAHETKRYRRRLGAFLRLHRGRRRRRHQQRLAARAARRARWRRAASTVFGLLAAAGLLLAVAYALAAGRRGGGTQVAVARAPSPPDPAPPDPQPPDDVLRTGNLTIPAPFLEVVSLDEPGWVARFERDPDGARQQLESHLQRLEGVAPLGEWQRVQLGDVPLPEFGAIQFDWPRADYEQVATDLQALAEGEVYDPARAARIQAQGRQALQLAAQQLETTSTGTPESLREAQHLQRLLREATGYDGIELFDDPSLSPAQRVLRNRHTGRLWRWFLHEVGYSADAWRVYRRLRSR